VIESLPPKQRAVWVCDDLIQRLSECNDAKFPGLSEMRIQELNQSLKQIGIVIEPITIRRIEQIGQQVDWIDPDGLSKGTMRFNVCVLQAVGKSPIEQAKWVETRGGIDIQSSRLKLIAILRAWSRVIQSIQPEVPISIESDAPKHPPSEPKKRKSGPTKEQSEAKQYQMLCMISEHPTLQDKPQQLADSLGVHRTTVDRWLRAFEERTKRG